MTELEARCLVERWMRECSLFKTEVVSLRPGQHGDWIVVVEYNTSFASPPAHGENNAAFLKDERHH